MDIREVRDKVFSFLFPVLLVAVILGTIVWVCGKTYFWDTSSLKLQIDEPSRVTVNIQANLFEKRIQMLGFDYDIHFFLPWSREVSCQRECLIERLPAGSGFIVVANPTKTENINISVIPDTIGTVDLRSPWKISKLSIETIQSLQSPPIPDTEKKMLGFIAFTNSIQGFSLIQKSSDYILYEHVTKQLLPLPLAPTKVFRGSTQGQYYLVDDKGVISLYDRYGRASTRLLAEITHQNITLQWSRNTTFVYKNHTETLPGIWVPFLGREKPSFTNGEEIVEIE